MTVLPAGTPIAAPRHTDRLSIAQAVVSGLGLAFSLLAAGLLFFFGLVGIISQSLDLSSAVPLFALAWVSLLAAVLALPSLVYSIQRLRGRETRLPAVSGFRLASILILLWPLVLLIGNYVSGYNALAWLVFPPLHLLAIGLPIWWLFELARHRLPSGSAQRSWGLLNFSLFITTPVLVIIETIAIVLLIILAVVWINSRPDLMAEIEQLAQRLMTAQVDPNVLLDLARPYLQKPAVIFGLLAVLAGLVPLLEELFKPLAVWLLAGRKLLPAEGFVAGALCGAGFALLESLLSISSSTQSGWVTLVAGRAGTGLLHMTTTALTGWALASTWQDRNYGRFILAYLIAAALHGIWNTLSVLTGISPFLTGAPDNLRFLSGLSQAAPTALIFLVLVLFLLLWGCNRILRRNDLLRRNGLSRRDQQAQNRVQ